jgi:hypothetical protein
LPVPYAGRAVRAAVLRQRDQIPLRCRRTDWPTAIEHRLTFVRRTSVGPRRVPIDTLYDRQFLLVTGASISSALRAARRGPPRVVSRPPDSDGNCDASASPWNHRLVGLVNEQRSERIGCREEPALQVY